MKRLNIQEVSSFLADCPLDKFQEPVAVVRGKKPVAVLVPVGDADMETVALCYSARFLAILERSQKRYEREGSISDEEIRREFGLPPYVEPKAKAKPGRKKASRRKEIGERDGSQG